MKIVDNCSVPVPLRWHLAVGVAICGITAAVAAVAAAILGAPVAATAAGAFFITAQALVIGWGTSALLRWIFLNRRPGCCF